MAKTEARLTISAQDETRAAFESIKKRVNGLDKDFSSAKASIAATSRVVGGFVGALAAAAGISASIGEIAEVNRETGKLRASLITVTGSIEAANQAFLGLQQFSDLTGVSIEGATEAFIGLATRGIQPTEERLRAFGNIAATIPGKNISQFIEAVADAVLGQYERLNEFGIKAGKEGEKIRFVFQGVTTDVKNSSDEIVEYLQRIGETQFAGALENQSKEIGGALDRAGQAVDSLARTIGESGVNQLIIDIANGFRHAVNWVDQFIQRFRDAEKITSLDAVEAEIASVTQKMETFQERYERALEKLNRAVSMQGPQALTAPHRQAVVDLVAQYQEWEKRLESLKKRQAELANTKIPSVSSPTPTGGDDGGTGDKIRASIDATIARLKVQAATLGMTSVEAELYKLKLEGASDAQLEAARTALQAVEAHKALGEQQEKNKKASEEAEQSERAQSAALAQSAEQVLNTIDPMRALRKEQEQIEALHFKYEILGAEEYQAALKDVQKRMREVNSDGNQMSQFAIQAARNIQDSFADFLFDPFQDGLRGMVAGFTQTIHRMVSELLAAEALRSFFTALSGGVSAGDGGFGGFMAAMAASVHHDGGIVGGGGSRRNASPAAFIGAPRLHSGGILGLKPNEVAAVLERGEEVVTRPDPRHTLNGGGAEPQGVRIVNVIDPAMAQDFLTSSAGERVILNVLSRNAGAVKQVLA